MQQIVTQEQPLSQREWFIRWYANQERTIRHSDDRNERYEAQVRTRFLAQHAPHELCHHTHWLDVRKTHIRTVLGEALAQITRAQTSFMNRKAVRLDVVVVDGAGVQESRADHYALWVREVYK